MGKTHFSGAVHLSNQFGTAATVVRIPFTSVNQSMSLHVTDWSVILAAAAFADGVPGPGAAATFQIGSVVDDDDLLGSTSITAGAGLSVAAQLKSGTAWVKLTAGTVPGALYFLVA